MACKPHLIQLPEKLGRRLTEMALNRDMTLEALVAELVTMGLHRLEYPPDLDKPGTGLQGVDPSGTHYKVTR